MYLLYIYIYIRPRVYFTNMSEYLHPFILNRCCVVQTIKSYSSEVSLVFLLRVAA